MPISTTMEGPLSTDRSAGHSSSLPRREAPRANTMGSWGSEFRFKSSIHRIHINQAERPLIQQNNSPETATAQRELPGGFWEWIYCVPTKMCLLKKRVMLILLKCNVNTYKEEPYRGKTQMGLWDRFLVGEEKGGVGRNFKMGLTFRYEPKVFQKLLTFSQQHWFGHRTKKSHGTGEKKEKNAPEVNRWKQTVKGRKKFDLQRLTYCQANPTWTGIYPQGHSQAGAAITIGKWTGVLACRTNSETTTCSVPEHIAVSSPANMNLFLCFSALHWQPCFIRTWVHSLQWHPAINRTNIFV